MAKTKNNFELTLLKSLNQYFDKNNINAICIRFKQHQFTNQIIDLIVDSNIQKCYMAIECKSIKTNKIYFKSHFVDGQLESETKYIEKSGRAGYLAVEFRRGAGKPKECYFIPWKIVYDRYKLFKETNNRLYNGFSYEEIKKIGKQLKREKGLYSFTKEFFRL